MKRKEVEIKNKLGLHARPAALVVKLASKYQSEIQLIKDDTEINAKSILGVMMLAAGPGQRIMVTAEGEDEADAVVAISELIESGFGEELS
jgi:phosphocarrier protein HPr